MDLKTWAEEIDCHYYGPPINYFIISEDGDGVMPTISMCHMGSACCSRESCPLFEEDS
jgi:hypothetical protein